jgi:hypothetical protein
MTCNFLRRDDFLAITDAIPKASDSTQFVKVAALRCEKSRTMITVVATGSQFHVFTCESVLVWNPLLLEHRISSFGKVPLQIQLEG